MSYSAAQNLEKIKEKLPPNVLKEGCSPQRIEVLRQAQHVVCLPELFRQLLLLIGESGIGRLLFSDGPFESLETLKDQMIDQLETAELSYPEDFFFFHGNYTYDVYLFFRTRDCEDDPAIYSVGARCFFKEADTLSEFILRILEANQKERREHREKVSRVDYYYNPEKDEFYNLLIPTETALRIEKAKGIILHRYRNRLTGCTNGEIEILKQAQGITCFPETYHQILLLMGKSGMEWVLYGRTTYEFLKQAKEEFTSIVSQAAGISYPQDIFVFLMDHRKRHFGFFRTKDCDDDPIVYGYEGQGWFNKLADTLSEFILQELDRNEYRTTERWQKRHQTAYCYDVTQDGFVQCVMPTDSSSP
jgi:hypothetical protein